MRKMQLFIRRRIARATVSKIPSKRGPYQFWLRFVCREGKWREARRKGGEMVEDSIKTFERRYEKATRKV